ncbi:MAG: hypothetical protein ACI8W8_004854 [Rhodothermales bacterium]|jgi:hypothetical protein
MAYNEGVAERLTMAYASEPGACEKKMLGGMAIMVNGRMSCGVVKDYLMVRVGPDLYQTALSRPHAREMDFTGRSMKGFVFVDLEGFAEDEDHADWVALSLEFIHSLPPK